MRVKMTDYSDKVFFSTTFLHLKKHKEHYVIHLSCVNNRNREIIK